MVQRLKKHPLSIFLPAQTQAEAEALANDISANGQLEPIVLYEGQILDGGHRYRACESLGIEPRTVNFEDLDLPEGITPSQYALSVNINRRHLTPAQRAMAVARALKAHDEANFFAMPTEEVERLQEEYVISGHMLGNAKEILRSAIPNLTSRVEKNEVSINDAVEVSRATKEDQAHALGLLDQGQVKTATAGLKKVRKERRERQVGSAKFAAEFRAIYLAPNWGLELKENMAIPVRRLAGADCFVILDTPCTKMQDAFELLRHWRLKATFVSSMSLPAKDHHRYERYPIANCRYLVWGVRGNPQLQNPSSRKASFPISQLRGYIGTLTEMPRLNIGGPEMQHWQKYEDLLMKQEEL